MAEGVTPDSPGTEIEPRSKAELEERQSKELAPYVAREQHGAESRFRIVYAALAGLGLAGVAAAVIFLIAGKPPTPPQWSKWKPTAGGDAALGQIAEHVAPAYRLPTGQQLVAVNGGPLQIAGIPVRILLRSHNNSNFAEGKGALFSLCGLGDNCSIRTGKPSRERTLLLRRESLELALYSFRYITDLDQVVVILPPPHHKGKPTPKPSQAMFFRKGDFKPQIEQPLRGTLTARPPSIPSLREGRQKTFLSRITDSEVYFFDILQAPDASLLLELAHYNIQAENAASSGGSSSTP
jgi:hypothetical protein